MTGKDIKKAREFLGINQTQLAERLGVTQAAVNRWEHNVAPISEPTKKLLLTFINQKKLEKSLA